MKIGTKPNGMKYLDVRLPCPKTGDLKRSRVSLDTRDDAEAKRQRADWLAGTHPKHPAQGGVIAAKGRGPRADASTRRTSSQAGMTLIRWLDHCILSLWKDCKGQTTILSNARVVQQAIEAAELADLHVGAVSSVHVGKIEAALRERTAYAEGSVKKLMGSLRAALNHAANNADPDTGRAWLVAVPKFPTYVVRNIRERVLSEAEEVALFDCIAARIDAEPGRPWRHMGWLLLTMLDTGFRLGEALSLGQASVRVKRWVDRMSDEQMQATYLGLARYTTKNDKPREVPATDRVLAMIPKLNALAVKGRWFPWAPGSGGPGYFWINLRADMEAKGFDLSDVTLHTMRHTCATRLCYGGMDLVTLRDWLGHSDIAITAERYIHLISTHLYQGAAILNRAHGASPAPGGTEDEDVTQCVMQDCLASGRDEASAGAPVTH